MFKTTLEPAEEPANLATAIAIAAKGFEFIVDKGGEPYMLHNFRVMNGLKTKDRELQTIAILHDCVEDNVCTVDDLIRMKFSQRVIFAVIVLTHDPKHSYEEYIKEIATCEDARLVKLEDLKDNMDFTRLKEITDKDLERLKKYTEASIYLKQIKS